MSQIRNKIIFFSPKIQIQKKEKFLIVGASSESFFYTSKDQKKGPISNDGLKIKINFPLTLIKKENQLSFKMPISNLVSKKFRLKQKNQIETFRAHLSQILRGMYKKHEMKLKFVGVGYKATLKKNIFILRLGLSHKLFCKIPKMIEIQKTKKRPIIFSLKSHFLDVLQNTAFRLRAFKKPELYKGKGILLENEILNLKEKKKS